MKGLVMLLSSNGTIIANRDQYMIGESLFGNQFKSMIKKPMKDLFLIRFKRKNIIYDQLPSRKMG